MRRVDRVLQKPRKTHEFLILPSFWETSKNARVFQKLRKTHEFFRNLEKRTSFSETSKDARVFQKPWKTHEILTLYLKVTIKEEAKNFCHSSKKNLWSDCRLSEFSRTMKFALVVPILLELFLATHACTEIRVTAEDKTVVVGRSMEFMIDLVSHIVVEPKDYPHSAELPKTCSRSSSAMTWTNSYKIAYLDAWDSPVGADGQNDAGLSVGALLFPSFSKYQTVPKSKCGSAISNLEFTVWILGNFETTEEVRRAWKKDSFPLVWEKPLKGETFELHWSITDKSGDGIII